MEFHSLLNRQIKKCGLDRADSPNLNQLMELINESYMGFEEDKKLLERSIDISSREYHQSLEKIKSLQANLVANEKMAGIGQLSAGIAHEINNPLGFMQSNVETLSKYIDKMQVYHELSLKILALEKSNHLEEYQKAIDELNTYSVKSKMNKIYQDLSNVIDETTDGIQRINTIVKSLLSFSRNGAYNEFEDYDFNRGIKDTITISRNEIKYHAKIVENLGELPVIYAKPGEINQVLLNVIMNAVYAIKTKDIEGVISICTYSLDNYVCCQIQDNGGGIPEEYLSHIFEPFFTTKPIGTGTGLGLSISYDIIVNKHKGKIDVKCDTGVGTTFTLFLPTKESYTKEKNSNKEEAL